MKILNNNKLPTITTIQFTREEMLLMASVFGKINRPRFFDSKAGFMGEIHDYVYNLESNTYENKYLKKFSGEMKYEG